MRVVSIITACLNNASTIESTIKSVLSQNYPIEYIIIDGGSTDGTLDIIEKYKDRIAFFISEKDEGIYHALNKGLSKATGQIVGFLHADDFYATNDTITKIIKKAFFVGNYVCAYGDLQYVDRQNPDKVFRNWKSEPYYDGIFLKGFMPPHPTFFALKWCYDTYGNFNTSFHLAADYELMLRFLHKHKLKATYIPEVLVKMRVGGESNKSLTNRIKANIEDRKAWRVNGLHPNFLTLIRKPLGKINQYL